MTRRRKLLDALLALSPEELDALAPPDPDPVPDVVPKGVVRFELLAGEEVLTPVYDLPYRIEGSGLQKRFVLYNGPAALEYTMDKDVEITGYRLRTCDGVLLEQEWRQSVTVGSTVTVDWPGIV